MEKKKMIKAFWFATLAMAVAVLTAAAPPARAATNSATVSALNLVSTVRTGRTTYDYTYTITVANPGAALFGAYASVTSTSPDTVIVQGTVSLGSVPANGTLTSTNTFTLQQNRLVAFNPKSLNWTISSNPNITGPDPLPLFPTLTYTASVVLPVGSHVTSSQLTVLSTADQAVPAVSGQFSLIGYQNGSQIAVVLGPDGNPMLLGWLDANHQSVSVSTTAEVFAYFALGGFEFLNDSDRAELIAEIPGAPGFAQLVQAISTSLTANPDAFAAANPGVTSALTTFCAGIIAPPAPAASAVVKSLHRLVARPQDVDPVTGTQSGVSVVADPPFAAHVSNATRRRAWAFVSSVSYTTAGQVTQDANPVTDFEVAPEIGLNGGINGAISDIINAYFGNSASAYTPVDSPDTGSFSLPIINNSDLTTYQVTLVGPGGGNYGALTTLPAKQLQQQQTISVVGFLSDALVPFLCNVVWGSDLTTQSKPFLTAFVGDLQSDFVGATPGLVTKLYQGQYGDALESVLSTITQGGGVLDILEYDVTKAVESIGENGGFGQNGPAGLTKALTNITKILGSVNKVLQVFDTTVYTYQVLNADAVDQFTVNVSPAAVVMNPPRNQIGLGGIDPLAVTSVGGGAPSQAFSYQWSTPSGSFGDLTNLAPGGLTHQYNYCSSSPTAQFVDEASATGGTTQTITVQVYSLASCANGKGQLLGTGTSVISYEAETATIMPANPTLGPGAIKTFAVTTSGTLPGDATYQWSLSGNGTLSDPTTAATVTYTAPASGTDVLSVKILDAQGNTLAATNTTIKITPPSGLTFTASNGSACCGGLPSGTYTTQNVPTGIYGFFCANYACGEQYGLLITWEDLGVTLNLGLVTGAAITGPGSWSTYTSILNTVGPGQFLFISPTSDNLGNVTITSVTPVAGGGLLATFNFEEGSTSGSSTRTYSGGGSFIIPPP